MARPKGGGRLGGRAKGTPNKPNMEVGKFCREVLESDGFQEKWRAYFHETALNRIEPKILAIAFAYAYGKPRERVEVTGPQSGPLRFTLALGGPIVVNPGTGDSGA